MSEERILCKDCKRGTGCPDWDPPDGWCMAGVRMTEKCWFIKDADCTEGTRPHQPDSSLEYKMGMLKWCQNCLMEKLIRELRLIRSTQ